MTARAKRSISISFVAWHVTPSTDPSSRIEEAAPGIFVLDNGLAAVLNQDGALNTPLNPASRGSVLQVFVTGLGALVLSVASSNPALPTS